MSDRIPEPPGGQPSRFRDDPPPPTTPLADGQERSLDPKSIAVRRIVGAITATVFAGLLFVGLAVVVYSARTGFTIGALLFFVWVAVSASLGAWAFFWPAVQHRHTFFRLDPRGLRIRRGVVWRSAISIPRSRIQHTDVSQGPIERAAGLATLIVHTAGTQHASISLAGLSQPTAYGIRDFLIVGDEPDAV